YTAYSTAVADDDAAATAQTALDNAITNITFNPDATVLTPYVISDFASGSDLNVIGVTSFVKLSAGDAAIVANAANLPTALEFLAALNTEYIVFAYNNNTYVYGDLGNNNQVDNNDLLIQLVGTQNLDSLLSALNNI
ncbi:MAG: hypothetical protein HQK65_22315, partial [Desulfamplus sp.]|nr:hypothetical protein [Desulfamplus sp.]